MDEARAAAEREARSAAEPGAEVAASMAPLLRYRDDRAVDETAVPLADLAGPSNAGAVRLEPGDDARALLPLLDRLRLVEVAFPSFRDGRGLSSARILREAGYAGELRAVGDVLIDQLAALRRCGFDSFAPAKPIDPAAAEATFARFPGVYQPAADGRAPIWTLRHPDTARG